MPRAIDHRHLEPALPSHAIGGADAPQERKRGVVTPHQDVLAVVDALAGVGIGEGSGAAAKSRPRLEDEDASAGFSEGGGGAEPRASSTNNDGVVAHARAERVKPIADNRDRAHVCRAIRARTIFGTRTRSVNTS